MDYLFYMVIKINLPILEEEIIYRNEKGVEKKRKLKKITFPELINIIILKIFIKNTFFLSTINVGKIEILNINFFFQK
jgi:hypothetical protein